MPPPKASFTDRVNSWFSSNWKKTVVGSVVVWSLILIYGIGFTQDAAVATKVTTAKTETLLSVCPELDLSQAPAILQHMALQKIAGTRISSEGTCWMFSSST